MGTHNSARSHLPARNRVPTGPIPPHETLIQHSNKRVICPTPVSVEAAEYAGRCFLGARRTGDTHQPRHRVGARGQQQLAAFRAGDRCKRHLDDAGRLPHRHPRCTGRTPPGRGHFRDRRCGPDRWRPDHVAGGDSGAADRHRVHDVRRLHRLSGPRGVCDHRSNGRCRPRLGWRPRDRHLSTDPDVLGACSAGIGRARLCHRDTPPA